jgi:predicted metal-dependent hydrolase
VHLMRLPEDLSDFIILHELCHTVHKNHGSHFHSLLNKLVGNEKELNKELKKYNTQL